VLWSPFGLEEESRVWESFAALVERYSRMRVADARSRNGSCRSAFTRTITARRQPSSSAATGTPPATDFIVWRRKISPFGTTVDELATDVENALAASRQQ
jgi:hypothetical protein